MARRQTVSDLADLPGMWRPGKVVAVLAAGAATGVALLVGLAFAVVTSVTDDESVQPVLEPGAGASSSALSEQDALAAAPMPSVDPEAALPGPIATTAPDVLQLPRPTGTGPADVPTGFPQTPEGALAQLAAIDVTAMQSGSMDGVRQVIAHWAAPGGPTGQTWSGVHGMARLLSAGGLSAAGSVELVVLVRPVMGLIKGTVGPDFAVVCVDLEFTVTLARTSRIAVADCQRMAWLDNRWVIGAGPEPAPAPSIWPGTDAAIAAGWRELRYV